MPLWAAVLLFLICVAGSVLSFRAYFRGSGKLFLVPGIALSLLSIAGMLYVAAGVLLVSSIR
ncbi:MAG: hypothetical protein FWE55_01775 [Synergistaceae bacterium]|nr:hypothetical protein [Synergistaceae bacterium]